MCILSTLSIDRKVILVTGAARGLGRTFADGLAAGGARLILADHDAENVCAAAEELSRSTGRDCIAAPCDVTDVESVAAAVAAGLAAFGRIDGLINNAGINRIGPSEEIDPEAWRRVLEVNLFGAFVMSQQVGRQMIERGSGSIVNIASIHAHVAPAFHAASAYSASKAGLIGLTKALAVEWGCYGVRVNALSPGFIRTDMTRSRLDDPTYLSAVLDRSPIKDVGNPEDLMGALYYLLSDASRLVTGQSIGIDGGWVAV